MQIGFCFDTNSMDSRSKLSQTVAEEKENKQELAKKRPSCTKLDLV